MTIGGSRSCDGNLQSRIFGGVFGNYIGLCVDLNLELRAFKRVMSLVPYDLGLDLFVVICFLLLGNVLLEIGMELVFLAPMQFFLMIGGSKPMSYLGNFNVLLG